MSRGWLYRDPDLRASIINLRSQPGRTPADTVPNAQRATNDSLRQRLDTVRADNRELRATNTDLREQLARLLGEQRTKR